MLWVLTFLSAAGMAPAVSPAPLPPGRYCQRRQLTGYTGRVTIPLGEFRMVVIVTRRAGGYAVHFANSMPDTQHVLTGGGTATIRRGGVLSFRFRDGWDNEGEGRLDPRGRMRLRIVREGADPLSEDIARNYGMFRVSRNCRPEDRRLRIPPG